MTPRPPLYVQIQTFIREGIESGRFVHGERLPSEPELARRFDTTRATVARAFQQLVFEGVISRRIGSGTYVGDGKLEDRVDTSRFEWFEEHVAASGGTLKYELLGFEPAAGAADQAVRLGLDKQALLFRLERLRVVDGRNVALECRFLPEALARGIKHDWLQTYSIQDVLRDCLGQRIGRIDNAVRAAVAPARAARMLGIGRGQAVLIREHTLFGPKDRPLLVGETLYPGDFSIRYTLRQG